MLKASEQEEWPKMYVYQTAVHLDLLDMMLAYLEECEHQGEIANCKEISLATVDDMKAWKKRRKALLLADFAEYITATVV